MTKPSTRIKELLKENNPRIYGGLTLEEIQTDRINAILKYLDEEYEKLQAKTITKK